MDLNSLSLDELKKLQKDVDRAIKSFEARQLAAARAKLEAHAKELGVTLKQVMDDTGAKKVRAPVPVKYRNPNNPEETWSGRGRKPRWLTVAMTSVGAKMEDFAV
ncbi:H-NS family nucleoid-associated regulatory protein [Roseinatronobacter monicus]|uniref:DNA-binding protein H-NS n=1 Tax=Roseinatronobacter monicus TaxID=393481 RepID=A0A543KBI3_9RHOB|nr:H-NS histone family protein [Roseinatronobacter monicus]TQM92402.1 DNA-binding protein H-NS [Roseinatronobacter monicus]